MIDQRNDAGEITWREHASCLTYPATIFFGFDDAEAPAERRSREGQAKMICERCSVQHECLEYALNANESYGIWGGLTEVELKAAKRAHKARSSLSY